MDIEIPDMFFVKDCEKCGNRHAPIRDCYGNISPVSE